jgi:hypothetical protein
MSSLLLKCGTGSNAVPTLLMKCGTSGTAVPTLLVGCDGYVTPTSCAELTGKTVKIEIAGVDVCPCTRNTEAAPLVDGWILRTGFDPNVTLIIPNFSATPAYHLVGQVRYQVFAAEDGGCSGAPITDEMQDVYLWYYCGGAIYMSSGFTPPEYFLNNDGAFSGANSNTGCESAGYAFAGKNGVFSVSVLP